MSVQTLDIPVLNYIREGVERSAYNTQVNEWYFSVISSHMKNRDIQSESLRLVRSWAELNELSYCKRYKQDGNSIAEFIERKAPNKPLTPLQFIKYVQCLIYNIEPETIGELTEQQEQDFDLLMKLELHAITAYVTSQEGYKTAKWSN